MSGPQLAGHASASNRTLAALEARAAQDRPIRVGVIGTGDYGETLIAQLVQIPGMWPAVVCDLDLARAAAAYLSSGWDRDPVAQPGNLATLAHLIEHRRPAIVDDLDLVVRAPIDVVVDCTGEPDVGCRVALGAIEHGVHVVMVNVEADVTAGAQLAARARAAGVVYSLADGDQPSLIVTLVDWARCLGLEVVCAGKWTVRYPDAIAAARLAVTPHPTKSTYTYLDGTKTQIEMASAANAAALTVDVPGMHGCALRLEEMPGVLRPAACGGILDRSGMVDYVNNRSPAGVTLEPRLGGGVWAVVTCGAARGMAVMAGKGVVTSPDGTHALLYRPNHLVGVETPWSICRAVLEGAPTAAPAVERRVEVVAVAKVDLRAGTSLGGLGTADVAGIAVPAGGAAARGELPVGLAAGVRLRHDVPAGTRLRYDMVAQAPGSVVWSLRPPS
ncbi:MAG: flagellar biosynthesis protein FlgA [Anaerolineae bacterium]|nr:flagellar biosynthesis protein FlgA [Anaerolineae bacterium]